MPPTTSGPYGDLIPTTLRVLTWNVWGRFGPWQEREAALIGTLKALEPDVVALQEAWCDREGEDQAARLAKALGYHGAYGGGTFLAEDWGTGSGLLSRWPIEHTRVSRVPRLRPGPMGGSALFGRIAGPRGMLSAFSVALDWPPHASAVRQASVRHLVSFVHEVAGPAFPTVICGDFNAPPDSDELRMLTGAPTPRPRVSRSSMRGRWPGTAAGTPGRATTPGPRRRCCRTSASTTSWLAGLAAAGRGTW